MPSHRHHSKIQNTQRLASKLENADKIDMKWFDDFSNLFRRVQKMEALKKVTVLFAGKLNEAQNFPGLLQNDKTQKTYDGALESFARKWEKLFANTYEYRGEILKIVPCLFLSEHPPGISSELEEGIVELLNKSNNPKKVFQIARILMLVKAIENNPDGFIDAYRSMKTKLPWELSFQSLKSVSLNLLAHTFDWEPRDQLVDIEKNSLIQSLQDDFLSIGDAVKQRKILRTTRAFYQQLNRSKDFGNRAIQQLKKLINQAYKQNDMEMAVEIYGPLQFIFASSSKESRQKEFDKDITSKHVDLMEKSIESISHHSSEISPPYKVGYFIYQTNFFPPARGRTALLRGHEELNSDKFEFFFYNTGLYRNTSEKFETFMERQLPEVTFRSWEDYFDEDRSLGYEVGQLEVAQKLLEQVRRDDIDIAIYAKEQMCGYLAIARAAPIQVFHSHGSIEFPYNHIDGYQNYFNSMKEWDEHENVNFFRYPMLEEFLYPKKDDEKYNQIRQKFDEFNFLYGCLDRLKKLENEKFLGTVRQILEKNPDSAFIIVGRGDATEILNYFREHDLDKRVFYEGYTDSPRSYQRALDVCLAPFPEFGGRAQIEFMANKTPVVSLSFQNSEDPELANYPRTEMVEDIYGIEGLYVDDGDTDKYVEIATRLNEDNEFYDESCQRTYRTFQRRFDIKKAAKKCEDFYTELIEQKRSG